MREQTFTLILFLLTFISIGQSIRINEIQSANNIGLKDEFGDVEDWIELYNPTSAPVVINDYYLSDKKSNPTKWKFSPDTILANEYLIVYASKKINDSIHHHANFSIDIEGEALYLYNSDTNLVDSFPPVKLYPDVSYGRFPDGGSQLFYFEESTPGVSNAVMGTTDVLSAPLFSLASGIYNNNISLVLSHGDSQVKIYYTLDGSEPTINDTEYTSPIILTNRANDTNVISMIPTNPVFDYPKGRYSAFRAQNRGWVEPFENIDKLNLVRAKAFKTGAISSQIATGSYLVLNSGTSVVFPVISIATPNKGLFSDSNGILVYGNYIDGNYTLRGRDYERSIHLTYLNNQSKLKEFELNGGMRVHGGGGRHSAIKNLRIYTRDSYGSDPVQYRLAGNKGPKEFKRFLIRGPGHRPDCFPRDDLADLLVENMRMDKQHFTYADVYLNGEYWGFYALKERQDEEHFEEVYDVPEEDLVILESKGDEITHGNVGDEQNFLNLINYVDNSTIQDNQVYENVKQRMDVEDFIDYQVAEIYFANGDWPNNNVRYWRKKTNLKPGQLGHDGKWRWIFYDLDSGFGGDCSGFFPASPGLRKALSDSSLFKDYTIIFRRLILNEKFKNSFVNRSADLLNTTFLYSRGNDLLTTIENKVNPQMLRQIKRWRYPSSVDSLSQRYSETPSLAKWNDIKIGLRYFMKKRPFFYRRHILEELGVQDTLGLTVDVNDDKMGLIQINSIRIEDATDGVSSQPYPWKGVYFKNIPIPVYAIAKPGYKFLRWKNTNITNDSLLLNLSGDSSVTAIFGIDSTYAENKFYINEFMASNDTTIKDEFGSYSDWIEIYNASDSSKSLKGYYITDKANNLTKHKLDSAIVIPSKGFLLLWADDDENLGQLHLNFKLSASGELIYLVKPDGVTIEDSISFGAQNTDISLGRNGDGNSQWVPFNPSTPNKSNIHVSVPSVLTQKKEVTVYPNPVREELFFSEKLTGKLISIDGRLLKEFKQKSSLTLQEIPSGVYLLQIEEHKVTKRIIVF